MLVWFIFYFDFKAFSISFTCNIWGNIGLDNTNLEYGTLILIHNIPQGIDLSIFLFQHSFKLPHPGITGRGSLNVSLHPHRRSVTDARRTCGFRSLRSVQFLTVTRVTCWPVTFHMQWPMWHICCILIGHRVVLRPIAIILLRSLLVKMTSIYIVVIGDDHRFEGNRPDYALSWWLEKKKKLHYLMYAFNKVLIIMTLMAKNQHTAIYRVSGCQSIVLLNNSTNDTYIRCLFYQVIDTVTCANNSSPIRLQVYIQIIIKTDWKGVFPVTYELFTWTKKDITLLSVQ